MNVKNFLNYYFPILAWMILIFLLSSIPGNGFEGERSFWFYFQRKGAHVSEYLILTILFVRLFYWRSSHFWKSLIFAGIISLLYAFSDEFHQTFVFEREGKLSDVGIDFIGIALGVIVYKWISIKNYKLKITNLK